MVGVDRRRLLGGGLLASLCLLPVPGQAGTLDGRIVFEMEYLGESYFSEQDLGDIDLPPELSDIPITTSTRFASDTWLPGPRLDLNWRHQSSSGARFLVMTRTAFNRERLSQDLDFTATLPGATRGLWSFRAVSSLREEQRSLLGHGDWRTLIEGTRSVPLGKGVGGSFHLGWEHSSTRGDTISYLYDFDLLRARARLTAGGGWLPSYEMTLEGKVKSVPRGQPGAYREIRVGGAHRPQSARRSVMLDLRLRDYTDHVDVGRDLKSADLDWNERLLGSPGSGLAVETDVLYTDYAGQDELYFDALDVRVYLPYRRQAGAYSLSVGPSARWFRDLDRGGRQYRQWTARVTTGRLLGFAGFGEIDVAGGYRDYQSESTDVIEITSLSSSLLRTDYWLLDVMAMANLPLLAGVTLDIMGSASFEFHTQDSERIHVAFLTIGLSRAL